MKNIEKYKNKEKRKAYLKKWRQDHKKEINEYFREYYKKNRFIIPSFSRHTYHKYDKDKYIKKPCNHSTRVNFAMIGRQYELLALKLLKGSMDANKDNFHGGYDIKWQDKLVEVKVRFSKHKRYNKFWTFTILKTNTSTHLLLFCIENNQMKRMIFMPRNNKRSVSVSDTNLKEYELNFEKIELPQNIDVSVWDKSK